MKLLGLILLQFLGVNQDLYNKVSDMQNSYVYQQSIVSVAVKDCQTMQTVFNFNSEKVISPASTQKLITTASAFERLGSNFRFTTQLNTTGNVSDGVLYGNLIITGTGDPSFGSERNGRPYQEIFDEWAMKLKANGIRSVAGRLAIDKSEWNNYDLPDTWQWGDLGNYYGALPYNININENMFHVYLKSDAALGSLTEIVSSEPQGKNWNFINLVTAAENGSGDNVYIYVSPFSETILLKGTIPVNKQKYRIKGAIPQPLGFFEEALRAALEKAQINIQDSYSYSMYDPKNLVSEELSKTVAELAIDCNFDSINLYADAFAKAIARASFSSPNFENSYQQTLTTWQNKGLYLSQLHMEDGSGLSPFNKLTTQNMVDILTEASRQPYFYDFKKSIARVGYEGTVKYIDRKKTTQGKINAKSGSISNTRAFAGYFVGQNNKLYSFMIGVTGYPDSEKNARKDIAEIMISLPGYFN